MADEIPQWADKRAVALYLAEAPRESKDVLNYRHAFARYIAEHEQPPVDPLEGEAKRIYEQWLGGTVITAQQALLIALRRGMELAGKRTGEPL